MLIKEEDTARFSSSFHILCCFLSVTITLMITMAPVQQENKKYNLKFKLSVVKYAEENSGEEPLEVSLSTRREGEIVEKSNGASESNFPMTQNALAYLQFQLFLLSLE